MILNIGVHIIDSVQKQDIKLIHICSETIQYL